jgi:ABC-type bacteriocin/lantibiotic exporter with double-glycine peptidase domain
MNKEKLILNRKIKLSETTKSCIIMVVGMLMIWLTTMITARDTINKIFERNRVENIELIEVIQENKDEVIKWLEEEKQKKARKEYEKIQDEINKYRLKHGL